MQANEKAINVLKCLFCIYRYFHQLLLRTGPFPLAPFNFKNNGRGGQQFKTSVSPSVVGVTPISPRVKTGHYGPNARRPEQTALKAHLDMLGRQLQQDALHFQVCFIIHLTPSQGHSGQRQDHTIVYPVHFVRVKVLYQALEFDKFKIQVSQICQLLAAWNDPFSGTNLSIKVS